MALLYLLSPEASNLVVENTAHQLLSSVAARVLLNPVVFGGGWPKIDFCHHLGISFRILRAEEAILADYLIRGLRGNRRLRYLHRLNDRVDWHCLGGFGLLSDSDDAEQRDRRSGHHPPSPDAHFKCLAILGCGKHVLGQREKAAEGKITRTRNEKRANCGSW